MSPATWKGLPRWILDDADVRLDGERTVIPYRLADGGLYAERVIAPDDRRWWRPGDGRPVIPYRLDRAVRSAAVRPFYCLIFTEGESDTLALEAALAGHNVRVLGIPGASTWKTEWAAHTRGYAAVYVAGDGDEAGDRLNDRVCHDVEGAAALRLPRGADVRALLAADGPDAVTALMQRADELVAYGEMFRSASTLDELEALYAEHKDACAVAA